MGRPRKTKHKDLPPNCYVKRVGGKTYYQYKRPDTGAWHSLGSVKAEALRAARILNSRLMSSNTAEAIVSRVETPQYKLSTYIPRFLEILAAKRSRKGQALSAKTLNEYTRQLGKVAEQLGHYDLKQVTRRIITVFLDGFPPVFRNRFRSLLHNLFSHAVAEGLRDDNPVEGTLKATETISRARLIIDDFFLIYAQAEPWMQRAMRLALITLQRRTDLVAMKLDDCREGYLHVIQHKTQAHLRLRIGAELQALIDSPLGASEFILHRELRGKIVKLPADLLSREFARLRDQLPKFSAQPEAQRPTFHEIRALGAAQYEQQGIDPQALLGHADAKTTRWYLDRHEVRWLDVEAPTVLERF